jgi:hypothetical protein
MNLDFLEPPAPEMPQQALALRRAHLLGEIGRPAPRRHRVAVVAAVAVALAALVVAPIGGASLADRALEGIGRIWATPAPPPRDSASAQNLAEAAARWNEQSTNPAEATGQPLFGQARDLLTGLGSAGDTIAGFPTANGAVCYEILAAGSCGQLDKWPWSKVGFTFSILYTRDAGTRVFGVASDRVAAIDVEISGIEHPAIVQNNAFYYQLPRGDHDEDIQRVIATWDDGTRHPFHVHDGKSGPG